MKQSENFRPLKLELFVTKCEESDPTLSFEELDVLATPLDVPCQYTMYLDINKEVGCAFTITFTTAELNRAMTRAGGVSVKNDWCRDFVHFLFYK